LLVKILLALLTVVFGVFFVTIKPHGKSLLRWLLYAIQYQTMPSKTAVWTVTDEYPRTQDTLDIQEIRDGVAVLSSGGYAAIIEAQGLHVSTMSFGDQEALFSRFTQFLNTLTVPVQFTVRLRKLSLEQYLDWLEQVVRRSTNPYLVQYCIQLGDHIASKLQSRSLISRRYFLVLRCSPTPLELSRYKLGFWASLLTVFGFTPKERPSTSGIGSARVKEALFQEAAETLHERCTMVIRGLAKVGVRARRLNTQEIIEVLYSTYNPTLAEVQPFRLEAVIADNLVPHHIGEMTDENFYYHRTGTEVPTIIKQTPAPFETGVSLNEGEESDV